MNDIRVFGETDHDYLLKVVVSRVPQIEAGATNPGGAYTLTRAPLEDGWAVQGRVLGVMRSVE